MNKMKKILKREKGFSLIELLIVIAIIAILAGLIIPRVMSSLSDAETNTNSANVKLVQSAVERYYFEEKKYPIGETSPGQDDPNGTINIDFLIDGGYIDKDPGGTYTLTDGVVQ